MTSTDGASPQISEWEVVVRVDLTFPRTVRKCAREMLPKGLMSWCVIPEPDYMIKEAFSDD